VRAQNISLRAEYTHCIHTIELDSTNQKNILWWYHSFFNACMHFHQHFSCFIHAHRCKHFACFIHAHRCKHFVCFICAHRHKHCACFIHACKCKVLPKIMLPRLIWNDKIVSLLSEGIMEYKRGGFRWVIRYLEVTWMVLDLQALSWNYGIENKKFSCPIKNYILI